MGLHSLPLGWGVDCQCRVKVRDVRSSEDHGSAHSAQAAADPACRAYCTRTAWGDDNGADPLVRSPLQRRHAQAENADIVSYASFNDFFTRPLKPGVRPLADADFVCPVDGAISQFGAIDDHHIVQAKNHSFTATALVGGDAALAAPFRHGSFANLYLSPRDYHRLHMPCDGRLLRMIHVPGALFSVNPVTARGVPGLFARNERVVCVFESPIHGLFVMVLVGATIVGSMATAWHGVVNEARTVPDCRLAI
jgi:phosphatidylserine decarboxylase precursor